MTQLKQKESELIRRLLFIENSQERMAILMDRAKRSANLAASEKTEENRIQGCISRVWVVVAIEQGKCSIRFEAESAMVKALVGLVCELYQGADPAEVPGFNPVLLEELHFNRELTPTRLNGLHQVIDRLKSRIEELNSQISGQGL